jgi:hypothetical protein
VVSAVVDDLARAFETDAFDAFVAALRARLVQLGVRMVDGRVVDRAEADALVAAVVALIRDRVLGKLAGQPGDALRVLDALRATGFVELEAERPRHERECARQFPPPPPARWREIAQLRALAASHPAHCRIGEPVTHVEFAARLAAEGTELPGELLALYAACSHVELACRNVAASAGSVCPGEALRIRDGRLILFDRKKRHPAMLLVEQPGVSIAQALGTWWLVLEDDRAPVTRRPLDLQGMLRFAILRMDAPSLEVLFTDLSWRSFFV